MSKKNSKIETPVEDSNVVVNVNPVTEQFGGILNTLSSFRSSITMLQNQVRALEKNVSKQMRQFARQSKKNKKNTLNFQTSCN